MSSLPTRSALFPAGSLVPANAKTYVAALYDFVAQRLAAGTSGAGTASAAELQTSRESLGVGSPGLKNAVINGAMAIDQVNSGSAQTFTAAAALAWCIDQWYGYCTGANVTGQRLAGSGASRYRYRFTGAASVTAIGFGQRIEASNSYHLNNATATFSVDLANSVLTSVGWALYYANTTDTFGTLASPTRTLISSGTFTVTSTVTRYSAQISVPSGATTGLELVLTVGAQTSGTWTVGDAQIEAGGSSTPFERRPEQFELSLCERYYEQFQVGAVSPAAALLLVPYYFRQKKRATPSVATVSAGAGANATVNSDTDGLSVNGGGFIISASAINGYWTGRTLSASARLP